MKDVVIDVVAIPLAALRVARRRSRDREVGSDLSAQQWSR